MLTTMSCNKFNADRRVIRTNHAEQDYSIQNLVYIHMPFLTVRFSTWAKETMRVLMTTNAKLAMAVIAISAALFVRFGKVGILCRNVSCLKPWSKRRLWFRNARSLSAIQARNLQTYTEMRRSYRDHR